MKLKIIKTIYENGDETIEIDSDFPYSKIVKEFEQEIEIDDTKWKEISG